MSGWPRRSSTRWPDAVDEDEYECMACKQWKPWFCYAGMFQLVAPFKDATHSHWLDFSAMTAAIGLPVRLLCANQ